MSESHRADLLRRFAALDAMVTMAIQFGTSAFSSPREALIVFSMAAESLRYAATLDLLPEERAAFEKSLDYLLEMARESGDKLRSKQATEVDAAVKQAMAVQP